MVLKLLVKSGIVKVEFHYIHFVLISITVMHVQKQLMVLSVFVYGFIVVMLLVKKLLQHQEKQVQLQMKKQQTNIKVKRKIKNVNA